MSPTAAILRLDPRLLSRAIDRFHASYIILPSACWYWVGNCGGTSPYGRICVGRHRDGAHRFAVAVVDGRRIPRGYDVHHKCGEERCVNPRHLVAVTPAVNQKYRRRVESRCPKHGRKLVRFGRRGPRCPGCHADRERLRRAALRRTAGSATLPRARS